MSAVTTRKFGAPIRRNEDARLLTKTELPLWRRLLWGFMANIHRSVRSGKTRRIKFGILM